MPPEPRHGHIAERIDDRAGDTGYKTEGSEVKNIDIVVLLTSADGEASENLRKGHQEYRLVVDYRLDTRLDARRLDRLHDSLLTYKEEPQSAGARHDSGEQAHADKHLLIRNIYLVSAYEVEHDSHYLLRQFFSESARNKVRDSYQSRSVNRMRSYRRSDAVLSYSAEGTRALAHNGKQKIHYKF